MTLDLTDDEASLLLKELKGLIDGDEFLESIKKGIEGRFPTSFVL